ncbi:unnamed protein product, partial [Coccothraustes coccothraustes]
NINMLLEKLCPSQEVIQNPGLFRNPQVPPPVAFEMKKNPNEAQKKSTRATLVSRW